MPRVPVVATLLARDSLVGPVPDTRSGTGLPLMVRPDSWARRLGRQHAAQERAARETSQAARQAAMDDASTALARWPRIVDAMTRLVADYNEGAGREAINIADDRSASGGPTVILRAGGDDAPRLTVTLEEAALYARRPGSDTPSAETEYRLGADRSDHAIAAYVLQHWMTQL